MPHRGKTPKTGENNQ